MPRAKKRHPLAVGSQYSREYKGKKYLVKVVRLENGRTGYKVGQDVFTSPSTAARSITGSHVNGWSWWKIEQRGDRS
jgi:hypothetical protein